MSEGNKLNDEYNPEKGLPNIETQEEGKNTNNVIGGLKATLSNDNNSEEAKQNAQERLDKLESSKNLD